MRERITDIRKGDRFYWNGVEITVLRVARDGTWADLRVHPEGPGSGTFTKRQSLPLPAGTIRIEDGPL
jgi:hypothetical protein